jgi:pSer/pThr/pTyr-binding forkhead associated (FHA) protein
LEPKLITPVLVVHENGRPSRALSSLAASIVIGRDPTCDLVLPDPSVSERHAEVKAIADKHIIDDLESDSGISVGGRRVEFHVLGPGDRVQIGAFQVEYLEQATDASTTTETKPTGWTLDVVTYRELVERQGSIRLDMGLKQSATIISEDDPSQSWRPDERMVFGAEGVPVEGIGASAEVTWNGRAHVINRLGWRSSLSVNGQAVDSHVLVTGDRFHVGKSRFRYQ